MIGQNLRVIYTYVDGKEIRQVYFSEPRAGEDSKYLGERIWRDGELILDSYGGK
jgi:hypothetical protein